MTQQHGLSFSRIMGYTATVVATLALLLVAYRLAEVVLLFVLSIVAAAALRKGVIVLESRRVPRSLAILFWYLVIVGVLGLGIYVLGAALGDELQRIGDEFPRRYDSSLNAFQQRGTEWQRGLAQRLPSTETVIQSMGEGGAAEIGFQIAGLTTGLLNLAISLVAVLTLTFYWLLDQEHFERLWLTLLPVQQRAIARHTWHGIEHRVGAYVRSEAAQFVLTIAVLWLAFRALGIAYPTLFALYAGFVQLIPWVGIPLTLLPITLMIVTEPLWVVLATAAVIIGLGVLMDRWLEPWLRGDAVVHPILTVLALMILGEASGVIGMLIALPLAATFQIVLAELVRFSTAPKAATVAMETTQLKELRARVDKLRDAMPADEERRREAEGMLSRLRDLMEKTDEIVREQVAATQRSRGAATRRRLPSIFQRTRTS